MLPTRGQCHPQLRPRATDIAGATITYTFDVKNAGNVTGELKSSLSATADFLVTISWANATGDLIGRGFQVVKAREPGKSEKIEITAKVGAGATRCVTGVEYGTTAK